MKNTTFFFLVNLIALFSCNQLSAQTGTKFWFAAPDISYSHANNSVPLNLHITAVYATHVTISRPADLSFTPVQFDLNDQQTQVIQLETLFGGNVSNIEVYARDKSDGSFIQNKGFLITAVPGEITASYEATGSSNQNGDIVALKSTNALGKDFWVSTQRKYKNHGYSDDFSGFVVVATADGTVVNVDPKGNNLLYHGTSPFSVTLNKGQTFAVRAAGQAPAQHIFGIKVTSNKDIAITFFDDSMQITDGGGSWNLFADQLIPTSLVGNEYVIVKGNVVDAATDVDGEAIFITPTVNGTDIYIDGVKVNAVPLNAGGYFQYNVPNYASTGKIALHVRATKPIYLNHITGYWGTGARELGGAILPSVDPCKGSHSVTVKRIPAEGFAFFNNLIVQNDTVKGSPTKNRAIYSFTYSINGGSPIAINPNHFTYIMDSAYAVYDRTKTGGKAYYDSAVDGQTIRVDNNLALFHFGTMQANQSSGCKYGYFSEYAVSKFAAGIGGFTSPSSDVYCNLNPIRLVANGATTYKWYTPYDPELVKKLDYDTVAAPYFYPDKKGIYYFNVIMSGNCMPKDTLMLEVIVLEAPTADFSMTDHGSCSMLNDTISNQMTPVSGLKMIWRFAGPSFYQEINQDTIPLIFGKQFPTNFTDTVQKYIISLTASLSGNTCLSVKYDTMVKYPQVHADFTVSDTIGCSPLEVSTINNSVGSISSYYWESGAGIFSNEENPIFTYYNTQPHDTIIYMRLIARSNYGCEDTTYQRITVSSGIYYQLLADSWSGCSPLSKTLSINGALFADSIAWNIDYNDSIVAYYDTLSLKLDFINNTNILDTILIKTFAFTSNGCQNSITKELFVYPKVNADFAMTDSIGCSPYNVSLTNNSTGNISDYLWNSGLGESSIEADPGFVYSNTQHYDTSVTISLIVSSDFGCKDSAYHTVKVLPEIAHQLLAESWSGCSPAVETFLVQGTAHMDTIEWQIQYNENMFQYRDSLSIKMTFINDSNFADTIIIKTTTINRYGCMSVEEKNYIVHPQVIADFELTLLDMTYPVEISTVNTSQNASTFNWDFGDGTDSQEEDPTHTYTSAHDTTFTIQLIAANTHCSDTAYKSVNVIRPSSITEYNPEINIINMYFNPTDQNLVIKHIGEPVNLHTVSVYNNVGSLVYAKSCNDLLEDEALRVIPIKNLSKGNLYIISLDIDGELLNQKILVP